jgi:hypothetical protein
MGFDPWTVQPIESHYTDYTVLLLTRKKASQMKEADLRNMLKEASKCVCTSIIQVSRKALSPSAAVSSCMKIPENIEEDPYDPEPVDEGDIQMEYSSVCLCSPSTRAITKYYL